MKKLTLAVAVALAVPSAVIAQEFTLEEIVVTAQKRAQNMNDVGVAISAFSGEQMKELGISNATDMAAHTPGLVLTETQPAGIPIYTIRGVGFDDISVSSSSTVGVYVDEVALPYPAMTRGMSFDVERIEVLKGPQGDLYGRNNTGGAINFVNNKPTEEFEAGVSVDYGRYDYTKVESYISGSLTDSVNGRLALNVTQQDDWQESISSDDEHGEKDEMAVRILLDWAASDNVNVLFNVHANRDKSDNQAAYAVRLHNFGAPVSKIPALGSGPGYDDLLAGDYLKYAVWSGFAPTEQTFIDISDSLRQDNDPRSADWSLKPERDNDAWGGSVTVNWDINDAYSLTSITAYDSFKRDETFDYDGTSYEIMDVMNDSEIESWSQEARITFDDGGDLTWITGIYLSNDTVGEEIRGFVGNTLAGGGGLGFNEYRQVYEQETDTRGIFGHAEWQFAEQFKAIAGIRYTHEEREWSGCTYDADGGLTFIYNNLLGYSKPGLIAFDNGDCLTIDGTSVDGVTGEVANHGVFSDSIVTENVSGKIGLDYTPTEDVLLYASIGTGFKSGGYNGNPANDYSQLEPYQEEELLAYEIGVKATLLEQTMQLNGALFYYDYRDKQVYDAVDTFFGPLANLTNIPRSTIQGGELELQWRPLQGLDVKLAASYLDSRVDEYSDFYGNDQEGKELPQTPQWQYNGIISYEFPLVDGLMMRATTDFSYSDSYYTLIGTADGTVDYDDMKVDNWWLVNARVGVESEDGTWAVAAWVKNLEDKFYQPCNNYGNDIVFGMAGMGRTYGVNFSYYWN